MATTATTIADGTATGVLSGTAPTELREAFEYIRVSGRGQVDGDGPERQDDKCGRYGAREGYAIVGATFDLGVSGAKAFEDRPGLFELLTYLTNHPTCRTIFVETASRLARDLIVQELTIRECQKLGITVIEVEGGNVLTDGGVADPTRKLIRQILGAVSEWDKDNTVQKLRCARQRIKQRAGKCEGQKEFGAKPGESETLARILELAGQRSTRDIADTLNLECRPARKGEWNHGSVAKIIRRHQPV